MWKENVTWYLPCRPHECHNTDYLCARRTGSVTMYSVTIISFCYVSDYVRPYKLDITHKRVVESGKLVKEILILMYGGERKKRNYVKVAVP